VRQVFQRAKNSAPCVIFFDEVDALCPRRSDREVSVIDWQFTVFLFTYHECFLSYKVISQVLLIKSFLGNIVVLLFFLLVLGIEVRTLGLLKANVPPFEPCLQPFLLHNLRLFP
jgi:SpoVK/Ycf46/Vps4 family AAA+-type ATPase